MDSNTVFPCRVLRGENESADFTWYTEGIWGVTIGFRVVQDPGCRVVRGGSWYSNPDGLRAACRSYSDLWAYSSGFRVVRDE